MIPFPLQNNIEQYVTTRKKSGLLRELTTGLADHHSGNLYLNLNDYLQLSRHPRVIHAAKLALDKWGATAGGSPVVGSYWPIHQELEERLKNWCGFEYGLLWNSGFSANKALLSALPQHGDVVLADRYVHHSMLMGAQEAKVKLIRYQHLNLNHLEDLLRQYTRSDRTVFVITESVFSMDGDYPDLYQMSLLKDRYHFFWIVDEAHALGWFGAKGNGLVAKFGVQEKVDVLVATLGKALASQGAFTLFHYPHLRSYLINRTPEFVYSTYLTPAATAASLEAINVIQTDLIKHQTEWHTKTLQLKQRLMRYFPTIPLYESPILPLVIGEPEETLQCAAKLAAKHGLIVGAIRPPSVPNGTSRLRLSLNCHLPFEAIAQTLEGFFSE